MVDFDSARHHFASLQKGKKKDEAKIAKVTTPQLVCVCYTGTEHVVLFILKFKGEVQAFF